MPDSVFKWFVDVGATIEPCPNCGRYMLAGVCCSYRAQKEDMRRFEHWIYDGTETFIEDTPAKEAVLSVDRALCVEDGLPPPRLCCVIEALTVREAYSKYYQHRGLGEYYPMAGSEDE